MDAEQKRQRDLEASRRWKAQNRQRNRARDREYTRRVSGVCDMCGERLGAGVRSGTHRDCTAKVAAERLREVERLWNDGKLLREIAAALGVSVGTTHRLVDNARKAGYDLPHRYVTGKRADRRSAAA
jgi:hypothetical protein